MANEIYKFEIKPYGKFSNGLTIWQAKIVADVETINKLEEFIQDLMESESKNERSSKL